MCFQANEIALDALIKDKKRFKANYLIVLLSMIMLEAFIWPYIAFLISKRKFQFKWIKEKSKV